MNFAYRRHYARAWRWRFFGNADKAVAEYRIAHRLQSDEVVRGDQRVGPGGKSASDLSRFGTFSFGLRRFLGRPMPFRPQTPVLPFPT